MGRPKDAPTPPGLGITASNTQMMPQSLDLRSWDWHRHTPMTRGWGPRMGMQGLAYANLCAPTGVGDWLTPIPVLICAADQSPTGLRG